MRSRFGAFDLRLLQARRDGDDHPRGHLVLQVEDVLERAVETVRPQMRPRLGVDQLAGDPHLGAGLAHGAFQHVADPELAPDLLHVHGPEPQSP